MKYYRKNNDIIQADEKPGTGWKEITEEEYNRVFSTLSQITELKFKLSTTDYKAVKYAEGWYTDEEYATVKAARESIREEIRALENQL